MSDTITPDELLARQAEAMPERELQENVRALCKRLGHLYYHTHRSDRSPAGFPDCVIVTTDRRLIFAELKRAGASPTDAQTEWLDGLGAVADRAVDIDTHQGWPIEVHVWWPDAWLSGRIAQVLLGEVLEIGERRDM
jgi:hypothetical protein